MTDLLVALQGVGVTYPGAVPVPALRGVDLAVARGEHLAIMGRSGSGKTTLLSVLGLLRRPSTGGFAFQGRDMADLAERERAFLRGSQIGFVFQAFHLLSDRSILENVATGLFYRGVRGDQRQVAARAALGAVGLADRAGFMPSQLSGGEQQRAVIARALIGDPALLLCDEPTGDLDAATASDVLALLADQVQRGTTVIVITHDPAVAAAAHRTVRLVDGVLTGSS